MQNSRENEQGEFDKALAACSEKPIHIPGAIQPFGVLFALKDLDSEIQHCSANAAELLGIEVSQILEKPIKTLISLPKIRTKILAKDFQLREPTRISIGSGKGLRKFHTFIHRHQGQLILELEGREKRQKAPLLEIQLRSAICSIESSNSLLELCQCTCDGVKALTGLDGVMIYKFHEDQHGEVIAESKSEGFPKYLGLHYPASDIPRQARALFLDNWVRMIPDRDYQPVPIIASSVQAEKPLNLGRSLLRSVSSIHLEYLRNMGVRASLTISLIQNNKLWGLVAGHHYQGAKYIPFETRAACETLGRLASSLLGYKAHLETAVFRKKTERIHAQLVSKMEQSPGLVNALLSSSKELLNLLNANGAAVADSNGNWRLLGSTPPSAQIDRLTNWLARVHPHANIFHTNSLAAEYPEASEFKDSGSGIVAIKIPKGKGNYLLWFRPEVIQTMSWAGNPDKPVSYESGHVRLHPRASFTNWKQSVRLKSLPWAPWEIDIAIELSHSLISLDLELQFQKEQEARSAAERANQQKEQLLAVVSHDLKNPLTSLKLNMALVQRTMSSEALGKYSVIFSGMQRSVERMNRLIDDLLSIAKLESGMTPLELKDHPIAEILKDTFDLHYPIASEKGIQLIIEPQLPFDSVIHCDRDRVLQVLSNLIGNAIKFTPIHGLIRIRIEKWSGEVRFGISDSGPGISKENIEFIFDRYWQARQTQRLGTGLGLTIAKAIVESHGGRIWAESEPGRGSTFYFILPQFTREQAGRGFNVA